MSKINLKKITAVCIDGRPYDKERYKRYSVILNFFLTNVEFASIQMISTHDPEIEGVTYTRIKEFGISDYSRFCLHHLSDWVNSEFCLIFQDDGFILNPSLWNDSFYEYDYIGSPWPLYIGWPVEGQQVGNGGFSLRSKRLLEFTKTFTGHTTENEDTYIISAKRKDIEDEGLKIAPLEIARLFSIENSLDTEHRLDTCFGFHAKHLLNDAIKIIQQ
jgi:hypothetical protein